jgi:hypothetical protein
MWFIPPRSLPGGWRLDDSAKIEGNVSSRVLDRPVCMYHGADIERDASGRRRYLGVRYGSFRLTFWQHSASRSANQNGRGRNNSYPRPTHQHDRKVPHRGLEHLHDSVTRGPARCPSRSTHCDHQEGLSRGLGGGHRA